MKKIQQFFILNVLIFLSITSFGQGMPNLPIDSLTGKITYSKVVYVDSLSKKQELFSRAREWFAKAYKSSTNVIQMEDKENGKIVGKALMQVHMKTFGSFYPAGHINYTISVYIKDGKYKYEIADFYHSGGLANGHIVPDGGTCENLMHMNKGFLGNSYKNTYQLFLIQMNDNVNALIMNLKTEMTKALNSPKDNW